MRVRRASDEEERALRVRPAETRAPLFVAATPNELLYARGDWFMYAPIGAKARWRWRRTLVARVDWIRA